MTPSASDLPEHVRRNREAWDRLSEEYFDPGRRAWASDEPRWGIWQIPEKELHALPEVAGKDVIELGCGTAYWSAWLARRGARVVGIDNSPRQLESARGFQREYGLDFRLILGNAEDVPLPDASFDLALSEYGACLWCEPELWIPEAARLLRAGGELIFLKNAPLLLLCSPDEGVAGERLLRDYFGMRRFDWQDDGTVEFNLPTGEMLRVLRASGFELLDLIEIQAPEDVPEPRYTFASREWGRRWPAEEIWRARKRG